MFILFCFLSAVQNSLFGIVEPFPENIYPFEFTQANVTCIAYDSSGVKTPSKILFMRRQEFNQFAELIENGTLYFTNRTETKGECETHHVHLNQ